VASLSCVTNREDEVSQRLAGKDVKLTGPY
jgi:hypothetical protein